ncbi:hypothetical protein BDV36DRAFT_243747 [Aspergillus pseudocaelatus]|uniref:Uncharacterized protein n=1 Tax=Aspergillus pseudocaelatus TaxID=1825620 RepID=A0ABQ6X1F4_9EURO|nr:hypothetical protein BDV36DRAFT_243747 [Aspergillus pseudocaelatus]
MERHARLASSCYLIQSPSPQAEIALYIRQLPMLGSFRADLDERRLGCVQIAALCENEIYIAIACIVGFVTRH